jgi:alanyl-tRNA synthetase
MYNLRVLYRRAQGFIDKYDWDLDITEVCEWHAEYLKPLFPELEDELLNVKKILEVEKKKYDATKEKTYSIIQKVIKKPVLAEDLVELYDSQGINPEILKTEAEKHGKRIIVPSNFYNLVAKRHIDEESETQTERKTKIDIGELPETKCTYFDDWKKVSFKAKVLKIVDNNVVLDKTSFYPVSGGQMHDTGSIAENPVIDVFKQGHNVIHVLQDKPKFSEGNLVVGKIDPERRRQLTQHHTATHIINAAARTILGNHINQASAKKEMDKAYLDVTHYDLISEEEIKKIEKEANRIVQKGIALNLEFMPRAKAEKKYGMHLYQGGAVPGKDIRVVEIPGFDVEACGGTHLNNTSEAEQIKILKANKVKDGVVRITFTAGEAAKAKEQAQDALLSRISILLGVKDTLIVHRAEELFQKWKIARKAATKKKKIDLKQLELTRNIEYTGDILKKTAELVKSQPQHLEKTLIKFKEELEKFKKEIEAL